jgi:hypothetical protein
LVAQAGGLWTGLENTMLAAGLGQSRPPLLLGLGQRRRADLLRVRWPDAIRQAELDIAGCARHQLLQSNPMPAW